MKMLYMLWKEVVLRLKVLIGVENDIHDYFLIPLYLIGFFLSYIGGFLLISIGWYIYELVVFGHLNENQGDTTTALKWSFLLMFPIADLYLRYLKKELKKV